MSTELSRKWSRIMKLYEQMRDDLARPGPYFKRDMLALVAGLEKHGSFEHLHLGLSHYMLTLAKGDNRRSLTVGWQGPGWYHISACSTVEAKDVMKALQDALQNIAEAKSTDRTLVAYQGVLGRGYGEQIRGWDDVVSYCQEQTSNDTTFYQQMLTMLPEIRSYYSHADPQIWASRSLGLLGLDIPESRRFIVIASSIGVGIEICEKIIVASDQVIQVLEDFVKYL